MEQSATCAAASGAQIFLAKEGCATGTEPRSKYAALMDVQTNPSREVCVKGTEPRFLDVEPKDAPMELSRVECAKGMVISGQVVISRYVPLKTILKQISKDVH
jgi:hypothetical protein